MLALLRQTTLLLTLVATLLFVAVPAQANPCPYDVNPCPAVVYGAEGYRQTYQVFCWGGTVWHVDEVWRFTYVGYYDAAGDFNRMQTFYQRLDEVYDTGQECGTGIGGTGTPPP